MICPHCRYSHLCTCKSCAKRNVEIANKTGKKFLNVINKETGLSLCVQCNREFNPDESMEVEWEIMIENTAKTITRDVCRKWVRILLKIPNYIQLNEFYKSESIDESMMRRLFYYHFNINVENATKNGSKWLRENILKEILDE